MTGPAAIDHRQLDALALAEAARAGGAPAGFSRAGLPDLGDLALRVEVIEARIAILCECLGLRAPAGLEWMLER
jgi:hypothetical protein